MMNPGFASQAVRRTFAINNILNLQAQDFKKSIFGVDEGKISYKKLHVERSFSSPVWVLRPVKGLLSGRFKAQ